LRVVTIGVVLALCAPAYAGRTLHGLVFDDANGDGLPSAGEHGIANAVVAFDVRRFVVTDATGQFDVRVPDGATSGIVWVRVPDGFRPGPVFVRWDGNGDVDLALHRLPVPATQPLTFVVAADTHVSHVQEYFGADDLATLAAAATALDPPPAFFTVLGDVSQGSKEADYKLVDAGLAGLEVPWVPVPGNHDWYDDGEAWFAHYGPDNYSFDLAGVHFVVWNMTMSDDQIRAYLGAELAFVDKSMPIVALTHAPPNPPVIAALRDLGVDYVLTGHTHTNRIIDHGGLIELNTEPLLMGGLDFTPAGYRVVTIEAGKLRSYHRTSIDEPIATVVGPAHGACLPARGGELLVAAELDAGASEITARVDCATPIALRWAGGWDWRATLPPLAPGAHAVVITATSATGTRASTTATIDVCTPPPALPAVEPWLQLGGGPGHDGARARDLPPPLAPRWTAAAGGHVLSAAPAIADGAVYVATTDLGDGGAGGVAAFDLSTGAVRWRVPTDKPLRGGVAVVPASGGAPTSTVVAAQIDGVVLGLDARTGAIRWRSELSTGIEPQAGAIFASPATDGGDILVGHQRTLAALSGHAGAPAWIVDPVPEGLDSQSLAAVATGDGTVVGTFNRAIGGVAAWDRSTGKELWRVEGPDIVAINATPVISRDTVYIVTGADEVFALDLGTGATRWRNKLDPAGFHWGNATIGTPALAHGILLVPTLYRDVIALDATSGLELWRRAGTPSPLRATHYRGAREAGFESSPVITGDIAWIADTAGELVARDLRTGDLLWRTQLGVPVLAGLATSGDWLVVAAYDGSVRTFTHVEHDAPVEPLPSCSEPPDPGGCCDAGTAPPAGIFVVLLIAFVRQRPHQARPRR
jgi:outer membrane protein assembly factor BamB